MYQFRTGRKKNNSKYSESYRERMNPNRPPLLLVPPRQRGKDKQLRIDQYLPNPKRPRKPDNNPPNPPPPNTNKPTAADEATTAAHVIRLAAPGAVLQPAAAIATESSQGTTAGGAIMTSAAPSSLVNTISRSSHHQHCQVSSLPLEAYIQLYSALTKGTRIVQQVSSIEEPFYKITDLRALLDVHGLVFTRHKKRDLLDRLVGLRLVAPAQQQPQQDSQQHQTQLRSQQPQPQPPAAVQPSAGVCGLGGGSGDVGEELGVDSSIQQGDDTEFPNRKRKPQHSRAVREWQVAFRVPEAVDLAALAGWAAAAAGGGGGSGGSGAGSLEAQQALQEAMSAAAVVRFGIPAAVRAVAAAQVGTADGVDGDRTDDDDVDDVDGVSYADGDGGDGMTDFRLVEGGIGRRGGDENFGSSGSVEGKPAAGDAVMVATAAAAMAAVPLPRASEQGFDGGDGALGSWTVGLHPALDPDPDPDPEPNSNSVRLPIPGHQRQPLEIVRTGQDLARKGGADRRTGSEATTENCQEALQPQPLPQPQAQPQPQPQPQQRQHEQQGQQQLPTIPELLLQELLQRSAAHQLQSQSRLPQQQFLLQQLMQQQLPSTATAPHRRAGGGGKGGEGGANAGPSTAAGDVLYSQGPQQQLLILGSASAASHDDAEGDSGSVSDDGRDRGACTGDVDAVGFQGLDVELHGDVHAVEMEYKMGEEEEEEEEEEVMPPGSLGPQDSRTAVSVLQWLAPQVITFSQSHSASAEPLISSGQLVGRRVAFALVTQFRYMDARAGEEVLPPGIYQGRVTESLGCACQPDVCGAGWDGAGEMEVQEPCTRSGEHSFFFVRVMTQPHLGIRGRLELKLDLSAATRVSTFQELVGLTMGQLEDAWVLISGPVAAQEGPMGRSATGSGVLARPYHGWGTGRPPCRRGQGLAGALAGSMGGGGRLTGLGARGEAGAGRTGMSMRAVGTGVPAAGKGAEAIRGMAGFTGRVGRGAAAGSRCTARGGGRGAKATLDGAAGRKRRADGAAGDDENGG